MIFYPLFLLRLVEASASVGARKNRGYFFQSKRDAHFLLFYAMEAGGLTLFTKYR